MNILKTIRMPKAIAIAWLAALRGGEYKQAEAALKIVDHDEVGNEIVVGYCCLGVLEQAVSGCVEPKVHPIDPYEYARVPSHEWLDANRITFFDIEGDCVDDVSSTERAVSIPWVCTTNGDYVEVSELNDKGTDFLTIANLLEQHIEYTDTPASVDG